MKREDQTLAIRALPHRAFARALVVLAVSTACLWIARPATAQPPPPEKRGEAEVAVMADFSGLDQVSIRILKNSDKQVLQSIASDLGQRLKGTPTGLKFSSGDPEIIQGTGIGAEFRMAVVPRAQQGYLPTAAILETLAPYASRVELLYIVPGSYKCLGFEGFRHPAVELKADSPTTPPPGVNLAFYSLRAKINSPSLSGGSISNSPVGDGKNNSHILTLIAMLVIAAIAGAALGLLLTRKLAQWKAAVVASDGSTDTEG